MPDPHSPRGTEWVKAPAYERKNLPNIWPGMGAALNERQHRGKVPKDKMPAETAPPGGTIPKKSPAKVGVIPKRAVGSTERPALGPGPKTPTPGGAVAVPERTVRDVETARADLAGMVARTMEAKAKAKESASGPHWARGYEGPQTIHTGQLAPEEVPPAPRSLPASRKDTTPTQRLPRALGDRPETLTDMPPTKKVGLDTTAPLKPVRAGDTSEVPRIGGRPTAFAMDRTAPVPVTHQRQVSGPPRIAMTQFAEPLGQQSLPGMGHLEGSPLSRAQAARASAQQIVPPSTKPSGRQAIHSVNPAQYSFKIGGGGEKH